MGVSKILVSNPSTLSKRDMSRSNMNPSSKTPSGVPELLIWTRLDTMPWVPKTMV